MTQEVWASGRSWGWIVVIASAALGCGAPLDENEAADLTQEATESGVVPVSIATGWAHNCVVMSDTTVRCWGRGDAGELGNGRYVNKDRPIKVPGVSGIVQLSASFATTCGATSDGHAYCWGYSGNNLIGIADPPGPGLVEGLDGVVSVAAGGSNTCALRNDGSVWCWGILTGVDEVLAAHPVAGVPLAGPAVSVSAGQYHTCVLLESGDVQCWGYNVEGRLGNGTTTNSFTPVFVSGLHDAVLLASGGFHNCALRTDGTLVCWGDNQFGALGQDPSVLGFSSVPVEVPGIYSDVTAVIAGSGADSTCVIVAQGGLRCWGPNFSGQAGNGTISAVSPPSRVSNLINVTSSGIGLEHVCAIRHLGALSCWGGNNYSQLGAGQPFWTQQTTPAKVTIF